MSELGHLGAEAHANALALKRRVEWELLDPAGRAEMVSAAMSAQMLELGLPAVAAERGLEWDSLSPSARDGSMSEALSEPTQQSNLETN